MPGAFLNPDIFLGKRLQVAVQIFWAEWFILRKESILCIKFCSVSVRGIGSSFVEINIL